MNCELNSPSTLSMVEHMKKALRKSNWNYLNGHPEIRAIIRVLLHEAVNFNPENIYDFAASLFSFENANVLVPLINRHLSDVNTEMKQQGEEDYNADMIFSDTSTVSAESENTQKSRSMDCILQYAFFLEKSKQQCPHLLTKNLSMSPFEVLNNIKSNK